MLQKTIIVSVICLVVIFTGLAMGHGEYLTYFNLDSINLDRFQMIRHIKLGDISADSTPAALWLFAPSLIALFGMITDKPIESSKVSV